MVVKATGRGADTGNWRWSLSLNSAVQTNIPDRVGPASIPRASVTASRYFWREGRLRVAALACAGAGGLMAASVIAGWYANVPALLRLGPGFAPVQFNAAMCLVLIAASLGALIGRNHRVSLALAAVTLLLAGLTLAEQFAGWSAGLDDLPTRLGVGREVMQAMILSGGPAAPGRMAPNTAAALALLAIALMSASGRTTYLRLVIGAVGALAATTFGTVALSGYVFGVPGAYVWGNSARMAPQSAVITMILGLGALCGAIVSARRSGLSTARVVPGLASTTVAIAALLMWQALLEHDRRTLEIAVRHQLNAMRIVIARAIDDRTKVVDRLAQSGAVAGGDTPSARNLSSSQIIRDFPGITAITWLDSAGAATWRMAEHARGEGGIGNASEATPLRASLLVQARARGRAIVSRPVGGSGGEPSVLIATPIPEIDGGVRGGLLMELVPARMMADVLPDEFALLYSYALEDAGVLLTGAALPSDGRLTSSAASVVLDVRGRHWRLTVTPTHQTLDELSSALPTTFLIAWLGCALLAGWIVRAAQVAAEQSGTLARTVADLAAENEARREAELLVDDHTEMLKVQASELGIQYAELQATATELEGQRDAIARAQEFSAALVRSTVDAVVAFDNEGRVQDWNPAMAALTGLSHDHAAGALVGTLLPFLSPAEEVHVLEEALAGRATTTHAVQAMHQEAQAEVLLDLAVTPMCSADATVVGGLLVARDVTEQRRVADVILASKEAAEQSNRAKSDFLARMSHELRTPLNAVIGFTNVIRRNADNHLRKTDLTYLDRIAANGKHLLALIDTVLDVSKIESGRESVNIEPTAISTLVRDTMAELDVRATEAGVHVHVTTPWGAEAQTDGAKLKQVLINLVGNAIKFTPRDGHVFVRVETDRLTGEATRVDVQDTGIGIPYDRQDAIFEAFEQADAQIAHVYGGTGLGLSISRKLCALMGHDLTVASEPGKGSTFSIVLRTSPTVVAAHATA